MNGHLVHTSAVLFQSLGQPIQDRHREHEDRPRAFEEFGKKLQLYMKFVDAYKQKVNPFDIVMRRIWLCKCYFHEAIEVNWVVINSLN